MPTALAVIDVQNGFVTEGSRHVLPHVAELVRRARDGGTPVFFTRFFNEPGSLYMRRMGWFGLQGPPETDLHLEIAPLAEVVFDKNGYTSFTPQVRAWLEARGVDRLVCCGIATEACVLTTATHAWDLAIEPVVVADACASHLGKETHEAGLVAIAQLIGSRQIQTLEEMVRTNFA